MIPTVDSIFLCLPDNILLSDQYADLLSEKLFSKRCAKLILYINIGLLTEGFGKV